MTGGLMLQHDEEMRDLSKSQLVLARACPFINAVLRLLQYLVYKRLIDLKIFEPSECNDLLHCTVSSKEVDDEDRYI